MHLVVALLMKHFLERHPTYLLGRGDGIMSVKPALYVCIYV